MENKELSKVAKKKIELGCVEKVCNELDCFLSSVDKKK